MTGIDREQRERRRHWAAEQLGLSPDASPEQVRAAWLRLLPEEDFVPPSESQWALAALLRRSTEGNREARADEAACLAEEERLRVEVEAFAGQFWDLPPDRRRRRWQELMDQCDFAPALGARLRLLEAGLDCVPAVAVGEDEARVSELAVHVRELFILAPGPRARVRQALLHRIREEREPWIAAVRRLRQLCPALASLGNDLLDRVKIVPAKRIPVNTGRRAPGWSIALIVFVAITVLRLVMKTVDPSPSTPAPPALNNRSFPQGGNDIRFPLPQQPWDRLPEKRPIRNEKLRELLKEHKSDPKPAEPKAQREEHRDRKSP